MLRFTNHENSKNVLARWAALTIIAAAFAIPSGAQADVPEYWARETFNLERSTIAGVPSGNQRAQTRNADEDASADQPAQRVRRSARLNSARVDQAETPEQPRARQRATAKAKAKAEPRPVRVASIGPTYVPKPKPEKSLSGGGGIRWVASAGCLDGGLRGVLSQVASRFGSVTVNSTCRSPGHNRAVGGASKSWHLKGEAADFRIHGNYGAAISYLRSHGTVGGFKHYGGGLFHIDTGPRRTW